MMEVDTPFLVVDEAILLRNIERMAIFARQQGVKLRPHFKAHKMKEILKLQMDYGISGVTVAKLGEAEVALETGIRDVLIASPLIGKVKLNRLLALAKQARLIATIDSKEGALQLNQEAQSQGLVMEVYLKVDTGLGRCGLPPGEALVKLAGFINQLPGLRFLGLMTHAGHVYGTGPERVKAIGLEEGQVLTELAVTMKRLGLDCQEISVGSTPTATIAGTVPGVTEIRPGNYVFNDAIQLGLGAAGEEDCALRIITMVVSAPSQERRIIDAGSKVFALDKGAHGAALVEGFGKLVNCPHWQLQRLSEELGILGATRENAPSLPVGSMLEIIPNHACTVINLADQAYLRRKGELADCWSIAARGKVQ